MLRNKRRPANRHIATRTVLERLDFLDRFCHANAGRARKFAKAFAVNRRTHSFRLSGEKGRAELGFQALNAFR